MAPGRTKDIHIELFFWLAGIAALSFTNPAEPSLLELCPLKLLGFSWCPGCGIGHSISFILHGQFAESLQQHWFGMPAVIIIFYRIYTLIYGIFFKFNLKPLNS